MFSPYPATYAQPFQQQSMPQAMPVQQPVMQAPGIMGRVIGSHEEIAANDVPMNGTAAYFPTQDGSMIYAKAWNPDGSITTIRYVPAVDAPKDDAVTGPTLLDVMDQLSDIQDLIKAERKPATNRRTAKKGAEDDASA